MIENDWPMFEELERTRPFGAVKRQPPIGYEVVDVEAWNASESLMSDEDIRILASGGLARCGLRVLA